MQDSGTAILQRRGQRARAAGRGGGVAARRSPPTRSQMRDGAAHAPDGRTRRLRRAGRRRCRCTSRRKPTCRAAEDGDTGRSARTCRASTSRPRSRRRGLRAGPAPARHAARPRRARRRATARELDGARYRGGREDARRGEGRARRQLHRRHRRARMAGGQGAAARSQAARAGSAAGDRCPAADLLRHDPARCRRRTCRSSTIPAGRAGRRAHVARALHAGPT